MGRRLAALLFAGIAVVACHGGAPPPVEIASIPACFGSEESGCENGKPLCAPDNGGACLMCRCTEYNRLPSDAPMDVYHLAVAAGYPGPHLSVP